MEIDEFAAKHKLKVGRDGCGDPVIMGEGDCHIFDYGDGQRLGVCLMFEAPECSDTGKSPRWPYARRRMIAAGFVITQSGDAEGIALFDPADHSQAKLAIKLAGIRRRRAVSPDQKDVLLARMMAKPHPTVM